jgi:hypothetical protein
VELSLVELSLVELSLVELSLVELSLVELSRDQAAQRLVPGRSRVECPIGTNA